MWMAWLIVGLLAAGPVVGLVSGLYFRKDLQKQKQELYNELMSDTTEPIVQKTATVMDKAVTKQMTGTYQMPGHRIAYLVKFSLETDREMPLEVPDVEFEHLQLGWSGTLTFQNGNYLNFETDAA